MSIAAFRQEFERHVTIVEQAVAQLSEEQLLRVPYVGGTSVTALATHLSSFLTARLGDILSADLDRPWRNHAADITSSKSRVLVASEWKVALATVRGELAALRDSDLASPVRLGDVPLTLADALARFLAHFAYHVGQVVTTARLLLGSEWKPLQAQPLRKPLEHVLVAGPHGPIRVAVALPDGAGPHPAVLIGHEGLGVTGHLLGLAHRLAKAGYVAVIPDLYGRDTARRNLHESEVVAYLPLTRQADPSAAIAALPANQQAAAQRVVAWFNGRDSSAYQSDFAATLHWVRNRRDVRPQHVGAIGFSFGGGLVSQLAAAGAPIAAGVVVYGQLPELDQVAGIKAPLLGEFAGEDPAINARIPAVAEALAKRGVAFSHHLHSGAHHGFFNETRSVHHPAAAAAAWTSILGFLAQHLAQPATAHSQAAAKSG